MTHARSDTEEQAGRPSGSITRFLTADHARLDELLQAAVAEPGAIEGLPGRQDPEERSERRWRRRVTGGRQKELGFPGPPWRPAMNVRHGQAATWLGFDLGAVPPTRRRTGSRAE